MASVFGTGAARLRVMYPNTSNLVTINLPVPNKRTPRIKPIVLAIEGAGGQVAEKLVGYKVSFVLEYELDLTQANGLSDHTAIKRAFNAQGELRLIPYLDQDYQEFSVFLTGESELSGLHPNKSQYGLCKLVYESKQLYSKWSDIDDWILARAGAIYTRSGTTLLVLSNATRTKLVGATPTAMPYGVQFL